ncbi:MAG: hypothetical protein ACKV1O_30555 [Saprospiraceae bacterium]
MSKQYDIRINPQQPSSEEIARHKNFDALLEQYQQAKVTPQPGATIIRFSLLMRYAAAVAVLVIAVYGAFVLMQPAATDVQAAYFDKQPHVIVPFEQPELTKPAVALKVNASKGGVLEYPSGSRLVIPSEAFMTDRGKLIEGEVDIHYREMLDYVDFFLAGVPMNYDSAGKSYDLESAGMVEIYAEQNGKRVNMAPGKTIAVELVSFILRTPNSQIPRFNVYKLDTEARQWVYQDVNHLQLVEDYLDPKDPDYDVKKAHLDALKAIESKGILEMQAFQTMTPAPEAPSSPQKHQGKHPTIELQFTDDNVIFEDQNGLENGEATRLEKLYKGTIWQISPRNGALDERAFRVEWETTRLKRLNNQEYELTFISGVKELKLIVSPVLMGNDYEQALRSYDAAVKEYEHKMAKWVQLLQEKRVTIQQKIDDEKAAAQKAFEAQHADIFTSTGEGMIRSKVINRFQVASLGIWSCDRPVPPAPKAVSAQFTDQQGQAVEGMVAYVADKNRNTLRRFLVTDGAKMNFDADSDNLLWMVTKDDKLALVNPGQFRKIGNNDEHTFEFTVVDRKITNEAEVRELLKFD